MLVSSKSSMVSLLFPHKFKLRPTSSSPRCSLHNICKQPSDRLLSSLSKRKHCDRFLSSLSKADDLRATTHIIRKFVNSSSESLALQTLSLLLSQSSPFCLPIYQRISATSWFQWTPKLAAQLIAVLEYSGRSVEARVLISESILRFGSQRDIAHFYCDLIDAGSDREMKSFVLECYGWIKDMGFIEKRPLESMVRGFSLMGMPADAEKVLDEMHHLGFKLQRSNYGIVVQGYGRLGLFEEMIRVIGKMEDDGFELDSSCSNVVLSCYRDCGRLPEMVTWMGKMRGLGIAYSVHTSNIVLNSCPSVVSMVQDLETLPLSVGDLLQKVTSDEAFLIRELASSSVLHGNMKWCDSEGKLNLHGFNLTAAYVMLLQWMEVLRARFRVKGAVIPLEISVVTGRGKHSSVRGESPTKKLVSVLMSCLNSPMRIDRKNVGRFIAKGKRVVDWLC